MFQIDKFARMPIYEQIIEQAERMIVTGVLAPDAQLPSVRVLSQTLSVNPNTLQKAYAELERRGVTYSVPGNGRFVAKDAVEKLSAQTERYLAEIAEIAEKLALAGISIENVYRTVDRAYGKEEQE